MEEKTTQATATAPKPRLQTRVRDYAVSRYEKFETSLQLTPKKLLNILYVLIGVVLVITLITVYSIMKIWL